MDAITLSMDKATADDLLTRLLDTPMGDHDAHEWYLIVQLSLALGQPVAEWMQRRAAVFAS